MECKHVKIVGVGHITCTDINPNKCLPGFFDLWLEGGERRIINGEAIVEVVERKEQKDGD